MGTQRIRGQCRIWWALLCGRSFRGQHEKVKMGLDEGDWAQGTGVVSKTKVVVVGSGSGSGGGGGLRSSLSEN